MSTGNWTNVSARTASEICKHFPLCEAAGALLREEQTPAGYLERLLAGRYYPDAVRFLAHALPKREAVWWACLCVRQTAGTPPPPAANALQAAENWVVDPGEDRRRNAFAAAEAAGLGTPAGCTAVAAFWSGGSLGPSHVPVIPPGEYLTARGIAAAILLAPLLTEPEKAPEKYHRCLALGVEVASGTQRWVETQAAGPILFSKAGGSGSPLE